MGLFRSNDGEPSKATEIAGGIASSVQSKREEKREIKQREKEALAEVKRKKEEEAINWARILEDRKKRFSMTDQVHDLRVDEINNLWTTSGIKRKLIYSFDEIKEFTINEDGATVGKGGVGRAIAGGLLFGGAGAVVGASTSKKVKAVCANLEVKITTTVQSNPVVVIPIIQKSVKKKSKEYVRACETAERIAAKLSALCDQNTSNEPPTVQVVNNTLTPADEILKYKKLMDEGIITEEEFNAKKSQLLGL